MSKDLIAFDGFAAVEAFFTLLGCAGFAVALRGLVDFAAAASESETLAKRKKLSPTTKRITLVSFMRINII